MPRLTSARAASRFSCRRDRGGVIAMTSSPPISALASDHYSLLRLPRPPVNLSSTVVKKAYHAALLLHHPDKATARPTKGTPTVDELSTAYRVLSTPALKRQYDAEILSQVRQDQKALGERVVQAVDLDEFEEQEDGDDTKWTKPCRCGEAQGYTIYERQLEEAADEGEIFVGCVGCSLWCKVTFGVVDKDEE